MVGDVLIAVVLAAFIVGLVLPKRKKVGKTKDKIEKFFRDKS
jgi:hypothetical protein